MPPYLQLEELSTLCTSPFFIPCIAALVIITIVYATRPKEPEYAPLFVPQKSAAGGSRKRWLYDSANLLQEAYNKFRGRPFRIWTTEGTQLVIPPDYVDELKMLPDNKYPSALRNFLLQEYLWAPLDTSKMDYAQNVIETDLKKNMGSIFPRMRDNIEHVFPQEFPDCKDWTSITLYAKLLRLVSRVTGKIMVGNGLDENEEWIQINCNYSKNAFISSAKLRFFHPWLRPIVQYFVSELRTIRKCNARAQKFLAPILQQRDIQEKSGDYKKPNDSVEWLRDLVPESDRSDAHFHGIAQLGISVVAVNTTSQLVVNSILNLATYPEYVPILQKEIESVFEECGGKWTLESMANLKKLDSFIKESLRCDGHLTATFSRKALQPITLSDGTRIPPGTLTLAPANAINHDSHYYPDPNTFDGLRFYKLRQASPEEEKKHQLTSISKTQLQFGSGRHACPGRWFASHLIKMVLAAVIMKYEIKLKDGEGRPKGLSYQINQFPDPKAEVLFRNKKPAVHE